MLIKRQLVWGVCFAAAIGALYMEAMGENDKPGSKFIETREIKDLVARVERGEADASILNRCPRSGFGILRMLVQISGSLPLVERLLKARANPDYYDGFGVPLDNAGSKQNIELLLRHGAQLSKSSRCMSAVITRYRNQVRENRVSEVALVTEALEALQALEQGGTKYLTSSNYANHPYAEVVERSSLSRVSRERLLSFFVQHGCDLDAPITKLLDVTVRQYFESDPEYRPYLAFLQREHSLIASASAGAGACAGAGTAG